MNTAIARKTSINFDAIIAFPSQQRYSVHVFSKFPSLSHRVYIYHQRRSILPHRTPYKNKSNLQLNEAFHSSLKGAAALSNNGANFARANRRSDAFIYRAAYLLAREISDAGNCYCAALRGGGGGLMHRAPRIVSWNDLVRLAEFAAS